jgi:galactofuranose transport system permease protein
MSEALTPTHGTSANRARLAWLNPAYLPLIATLLVVIALAAFGGLNFDGYLNAQAIVNLFNNSAYLGIVAVGMTFVILSGGIDLSVGSAIAFSTVLMAVLVHPSVDQQQAFHAAQVLANSPSATVEPLDPATLVAGVGLHPLSAALVTLVVGTLFGLSMGFLIATYELPPFMITLAGMFFARAMAFVVLDVCSPAGSGSASLSVAHPFYESVREHALQVWTQTGRLHPRRNTPLPDLPIRLYLTALLMLASYLVALVVLHFTAFGRSIYAVGGDEHSAKLLGVRVPRVKMSVYAVSGFCAALAGIVASLDSNAGNPADKIGTELDAIAAVVIGGTLLTGGRGFVIGTLLGVLVFALIQGFIPVSKWLDAQTTRIFIGGLMLVFILLQTGFNVLGRWLSAGRSVDASG